jgi:hypothetical protein
MFNVFFVGSLIAGTLLYGNTVSIMKKVKNGENTELNTAVGCILVAFILYSIFAICAK